jgi:hypothetical protein
MLKKLTHKNAQEWDESMRTPEDAAKAEEFRIRMLALGIDRYGSIEKANEWIEHHALLIATGFIDFNPTTDILTYDPDDGRGERQLRLTERGLSMVKGFPILDE